jgi:cell pole-organizing protein PopZ
MRRDRKSFPALIADVESAINALEDADDAVASAQEHLANMQAEREKAVASLADVRESLFKAYPEIAGSVPQAAPAAPKDPETGFESVEVDDEDDPRYTGGGQATGPVEFEERS